MPRKKREKPSCLAVPPRAPETSSASQAVSAGADKQNEERLPNRPARFLAFRIHLFESENLAMSDVNQDEHDRDAETKSFIERAWSGRGEKAAFGVIEERWDEQADHGED